MKPNIPFLRTAAKFLLVFTLPVLAGDTKPESDPVAEQKSEADETEAIAQMDRDEAEIGSLLQMSAPMELYLVNGKDPLAEAINKGLILNVTLDEAKTALKEAAATPDPDDDIQASELAHNGSFRFFPTDQTAGGRGN